VVAAHVSSLIASLVVVKHVNMSDIHIIGHGVGAHIAGFIGKKFPTRKLNRITGLDPSGAIFNTNPAALCLDVTHATTVDTIMTDGDVRGIKCIGHLNIYPSGGKWRQPGYMKPDTDHACAHSRSVDYFIYSNKHPQEFRSVECLSEKEAMDGDCTGSAITIMGDNSDYMNINRKPRKTRH
jgi:hypothetical protein